MQGQDSHHCKLLNQDCCVMMSTKGTHRHPEFVDLISDFCLKDTFSSFGRLKSVAKAIPDRLLGVNFSKPLQKCLRFFGYISSEQSLVRWRGNGMRSLWAHFRLNFSSFTSGVLFSPLKTSISSLPYHLLKGSLCQLPRK